jgi:hypothetical protein
VAVVVARELSLGYLDRVSCFLVGDVEDRQVDDPELAHPAPDLEGRQDRRIGVAEELAPRGVAIGRCVERRRVSAAVIARTGSCGGWKVERVAPGRRVAPEGSGYEPRRRKQ